jgi:hypothetical protein
MDEEGNPRKSRVRRKRDENLDRLDEGGGFQQRRLRDLNSNLYDKGEDKELSGIERDPEQFKANLNYIIDAYGCDLHDLAEKAGVEYRWLRRIVRKGLERRVNRLDRVASYFGLPDGDYLWAREIKIYPLALPPKPDQLSTLKQKINWPHAQRLLELLETGKHEYLKGLIDELYRTCFSNPAMIPAYEPVKAHPPGDRHDGRMMSPQSLSDDGVMESQRASQGRMRSPEECGSMPDWGAPSFANRTPSDGTDSQRAQEKGRLAVPPNVPVAGETKREPPLAGHTRTRLKTAHQPGGQTTNQDSSGAPVPKSS